MPSEPFDSISTRALTHVRRILLFEALRHKMKWWARISLAALTVLYMAFVLINSQCGQLVGKGNFVSYEASDRSCLRPEDHILYELFPPQATDIKIWSFRFKGHWGGSYKIEKSLLEAWAKEKQLLRSQEVATIEMCYSRTRYEFIDTSHGVLYRALDQNGQALRRDYLLYYDDTKKLAYFNLSIE